MISNLKIVPEKDITGVDCSVQECMGTIRLGKEIFWTSHPFCQSDITNNDGTCKTLGWKSSYSHNKELLMQYTFDKYSAYDQKYYRPDMFKVNSYDNCIYRASTYQSDGYYTCAFNLQRNVNNVISNQSTRIQIFGRSGKSGYCGVYGSAYLPGLGCITNTHNGSLTGRTVSLITSSCESTDASKNLKQACTSNPIDIGSASKIELIEDLSFPINFSRIYSSSRNNTNYNSAIGKGWRHNYDKRLKTTFSQDDATNYKFNHYWRNVIKQQTGSDPGAIKLELNNLKEIRTSQL